MLFLSMCATHHIVLGHTSLCIYPPLVLSSSLQTVGPVQWVKDTEAMHLSFIRQITGLTHLAWTYNHSWFQMNLSLNFTVHFSLTVPAKDNRSRKGKQSRHYKITQAQRRTEKVSKWKRLNDKWVVPLMAVQRCWQSLQDGCISFSHCSIPLLPHPSFPIFPLFPYLSAAALSFTLQSLKILSLPFCLSWKQVMREDEWTPPPCCIRR